MKHLLLIALCSAFTMTLAAQGLTRYGQITSGPSIDFVDKYGRLSSVPMLDANGKVLFSLTTNAISSITDNTAISGGNAFSVDAITARGVCWSTSPAPTVALPSKTLDGNGNGSFTSTLTGLFCGTVYYVRAYATNSYGTGYGNEISFTTTSANTVTDIDGNIYCTITIGTQVWMAENLKTTKYNDGTPIPVVTDNTAWAALSTFSTPGVCWYNNDIANKNTYGALYNWFAVNTGKLAPAGWHVATDAEWKQLEMTLGMTQEQADATNWRGTNQGTQLKNTSGWNNNGNGTNTSGFSALPGACRGSSGGFCSAFGGISLLGSVGYWWSASEFDATLSWYRQLYYSRELVERTYYYKGAGFSVRCVKD